MDDSNEKMEFIREICKRLLKDESCNINNSLIQVLSKLFISIYSNGNNKHAIKYTKM